MSSLILKIVKAGDFSPEVQAQISELQKPNTTFNYPEIDWNFFQNKYQANPNGKYSDNTITYAIPRKDKQKSELDSGVSESGVSLDGDGTLDSAGHDLTGSDGLPPDYDPEVMKNVTGLETNEFEQLQLIIGTNWLCLCPYAAMERLKKFPGELNRRKYCDKYVHLFNKHSEMELNDVEFDPTEDFADIEII